MKKQFSDGLASRVLSVWKAGLPPLLLILSINCLAQVRDYTKWVNPFIGTGGHGHTFPGATMPFGMVQLSPDTRIDNWDGSSGYHYSDDTIFGFSHTHLNGTGIPDYCDILFMPFNGFAPASAGYDYSSKFSHANEKAEPGYYSVRLDRDKILAELTTTKRVGFHRYTFPKGQSANVYIDLKWRDRVLDAGFNIVGDRRIEGFRRSSSWAKNQTVYFVAEFSRPFLTVATLSESEKQRASIGFSMYQTQVLMKVAISSVSIEGARRNLAAELPGWDFDKVRANAKAAWNKELSKIEVSGGTDDQTTTFYTALYHTMIQPNVFNDVDGGYRGLDGKAHNIRDDARSPGFSRPISAKKPPKGGTPSVGKTPSEQYSVFSLWDTFRAAHPLYTIIDQKRTVDFINTFIRQYEQGGRLPVWELWGNETDCMIGYHAVSVIADAMKKGIKGFDYEKAYEAAKHSAELDHFGLAGYKKRGYISMEDENESVSRTLEYAYDDWCIAQMVEPLEEFEVGDDCVVVGGRQCDKWKSEREYFYRRSFRFENLFDPKSHFFRPKKNGGFVEPFAPNEVTFGFTEGNSWQYSFFVPHNVPRLMELMGGREKFISKLDELFVTDQKLAGREQADLTGLIGQYAHGNEPSHHIAYLYAYAGQPWKTQKYVRQIMDNFYKPTPDGLIGNEDCGQMSAWYVLSAAGFYQVAPGSPDYVFGSPLFKEIKFNLEHGKKFVIRAPKVSEKNIYIKSVKHDDFFKWDKAYFTHRDLISAKGTDLMNFAKFEFEMTDAPATDAFKVFPGGSRESKFVAVPVIEGDRSFNDKTSVTMRKINPDAVIFYTTDGSTPTPRSRIFSEPFELAEAATVKAFSYLSPDNESPFVEAVFQKRPHDWTAKVLSGYSTQYTGGGDYGIIDGIRGTTNFASGEWQGVQGKMYEAVVDLKKMTDVRELGACFLQVAGPWIWMPDRVEFAVSDDGIKFTKAAEIKPGFPQREMTPTVKEYRQSITPTKTRYVRICAYNFGKIPDWHPGAGGDPWIFIDEVIIN